jgi:hypothetical protein
MDFDPAGRISPHHPGCKTTLLPGMFGAGGGVEIVVVDVGLHFDEVVGVEVVIFGAGVVVAGEALDGGGVLPKSEHLEMGDVGFCAGQAPGAAIAEGGLVLWKRDGAHEAKVGLTFFNGNLAVPDTSDHCVLSR